MPRKFLQKFLPKHEKIRQQKSLAIFGNLLYNPNLWNLNRRSASGAFAVGIFIAFLPLPVQMLLAAFVALLFGVNLPISISLVWISNPITMPIMLYFAYRIGVILLDSPNYDFHFELSWSFLFEQMGQIGPPLIVGCLACSCFFALVGYFAVRLIWRYSVVRSWQKRRIRFPRIHK